MGIRNRNRNQPKPAEKPAEQPKAVKTGDQAVRDAHFFENGVNADGEGGKAPKGK